MFQNLTIYNETRKEFKYVRAEGGVQLPIAHALRLTESTKNPNLRAVSLRFASVLWPPSGLEVCGRKEEERIMPSLVAITSALARTTCVRTHYVRTN